MFGQLEFQKQKVYQVARVKGRELEKPKTTYLRLRHSTRCHSQTARGPCNLTSSPHCAIVVFTVFKCVG